MSFLLFSTILENLDHIFWCFLGHFRYFLRIIFSSAGEEHEQRNLNVINNNNNGSLSEAAADLNSLKRRSYIPQDYLSQVLDPTTSADIAAALATSSRLKRKDFPKVIKMIINNVRLSEYIALNKFLQTFPINLTLHLMEGTPWWLIAKKTNQT